jgi:hypothetical protein
MDDAAKLAEVAAEEAEHYAKKRELEHFEVIVLARAEGDGRIAYAADGERDPADIVIALLMYAKAHADLHGLPFSFNQEPVA